MNARRFIPIPKLGGIVAAQTVTLKGLRDVRYGPIADIGRCLRDVRFGPIADTRPAKRECMITIIEMRCWYRYYSYGEIAASPLNGHPIQELLALIFGASTWMAF